MAGKIPDLHATARAGTGKGAARQARRDAQVPGVVYGGGSDPLAINIPFKVLLKMVKAGGFMSTLFNLKVEGQDDTRVVCRAVQRDVVKDLPIHVDFMRLRRTSRINLHIPVEFINHDKCTGLKRGGTLTIVRNDIELKVTAGDIPEVITVDLDGLEVGDTITISSITLPEGTRPMITDRDFVIANIAAPSSLRSADDEEEDSGEAEDKTESPAEEE